MQKPWNRPSLPIYSISSRYGNEYNMHICTYVSAVSLAPKIMLCAIYEGTKTLELVTKQKQFVLQLLSVNQMKYIKLLGKQSGHSRNKIMYMLNHDLLDMYQGFYFIKDCAAVMHIEVIESYKTGDHYSFFGYVNSHRNVSNFDILTTSHLREHRIIR